MGISALTYGNGQFPLFTLLRAAARELHGSREGGAHVLAAVTRSPGEMMIENVSGPGSARAGNVIAAIFSHHFPLSRATEAFEFAMSRPQDALKIVVTVN